MRLGQHFLKNKKILAQIVQTAELSKNDVVLEVGPGHGELTEFLARRAKKVIAVEKDPELVTYLLKRETLPDNIKVIHGDILKFSPSRFKLHASRFKIVANLPYYLTSRFLRKFLTAKNKPKLMVLMVQYEVAKRIMAKPPEMNLLALSVQAYSEPKFIRKVSRKYFFPVPKVDSAVIKIKDVKPGRFDKLFEMARRAFQQKRKMLKRSLKDFEVPEKFKTKRPQELSLEDWLKIIRSRKSQ